MSLLCRSRLSDLLELSIVFDFAIAISLAFTITISFAIAISLAFAFAVFVSLASAIAAFVSLAFVADTIFTAAVNNSTTLAFDNVDLRAV